jgi:hypothetical protein
MVNKNYQGMPPSGDAAMPEGLAEETKAERDYKGGALVSLFLLIKIFVIIIRATENIIMDIPINGILKLYLSARNPIIAEDGLARKIRFDL